MDGELSVVALGCGLQAGEAKQSWQVEQVGQLQPLLSQNRHRTAPSGFHTSPLGRLTTWLRPGPGPATLSSSQTFIP